MRRLLAALVAGAALLAAGCGEPAATLEVPERAPGQHVIDQVQLLDLGEMESALAALRSEDIDVVAVVYESEAASLGEADRAGRAVLEAWGADAVLVAVAEPGDFHSTEETRRRFFGVVPADARAVSGGTRERIAEDLAPPLAAENDWDGVFAAALEEVAGELRGDR